MTHAEHAALDALIAWRMTSLECVRVSKALDTPSEATYWAAVHAESNAGGAAQRAADAVIREREEAVSP